MSNEQNIIKIEAGELINRVLAFKEQGYRMVQICCTKIADGFQLSYSFDKDNILYSLRLLIPEDTEIPSISKVYWPAFIYENEMKELFGVKVSHIEPDYNGTFYRLSKKTPWKSVKGEAVNG